MTDVADDIRAAVNQTRPPSALKTQGREPDEPFMLLRAKVRGVLIAAHRELVGDEWGVTDDRILDIVTHWLEQKRSR